jgi:hypothetical protein
MELESRMPHCSFPMIFDNTFRLWKMRTKGDDEELFRRLFMR